MTITNKFTKISFYIFAVTVGLVPFFFIPILPMPVVDAKFFLLSIGVILSALAHIIGELKSNSFKFTIGISEIFFVLMPIAVHLILSGSSTIYLSVLSLVGYMANVHFKNKNSAYEIIRAGLVGIVVASVFQVVLFIVHHSLVPSIIGSGLDLLVLEIFLLVSALFLLCFKKKLSVNEKVILFSSVALALFFLSVPSKSSLLPLSTPGITVLVLVALTLGGVFSWLSQRASSLTPIFSSSPSKVRDAIIASISIIVLAFGFIKIGFLTGEGTFSALAEFYYYKTGTLISESGAPNEIQDSLSKSIRNANLAVAANPRNIDNYVVAGDIYALVVPIGAENAYLNAKAAYETALSMAPDSKIIQDRLAAIERFKP